MFPIKRLVQLRSIETEKHSRMASQTKKTIADLLYLADQLKREIRVEETRTRKYDPVDFCDSSFAKEAIQRCNNLLNTIDRFTIQLEDTKRSLREKNADRKAEMRPVSAHVDSPDTEPAVQDIEAAIDDLAERPTK